MPDDERFCRYADEAFEPRKRGPGGSLRHTLRSAAQIARGGLLAALDAASLLAEALIPGEYNERERDTISKRGGRSYG